MPRAPGTAAGQSFEFTETDLLMAAATMHEQGRLVEKPNELPIDKADVDRDPDIVGEPGLPRLDEQLPDLERDKERDQRGIDREKRMRERQEEFEGDVFRSKRK